VQGGGRTLLSQIVIEVEAHGDSQTMLRLSIDRRLVAENLTAAQARFLIEEILDRIPFAEVGETRETMERQCSS
jgi:hypothetical protein